MQSLYSNLISYWPLHEATLNRADLIGSNNALAPIAVPTGAAGIVENSTVFASASSQRLDIASNATLQTGNIDFTFAFWGLLTSKPAALMAFIIKYNATAGNFEYEIYWDNAADRFKAAICRATDSSQIVTANTFGAPSTATWYFITVWYDTSNLGLNISINNGVPDTLTLGGVPQAAGTANFSMGGNAVASQYLNGQMCEVGRWNRVLTQQERTWLYNNGQGRTYPFDRRLNTDNELGRDLRERRNRRSGMIT